MSLPTKLFAGVALAAAFIPSLAFAQADTVGFQIQMVQAQIRVAEQQVTDLENQLATLQAIASSTGTSTPITGPIMASTTLLMPPPLPPGQVGKMLCIGLTRNLTIGSRGDDVRKLQDLLRASGLLTASSTGFFGPLTAQATARFQMQIGISTSIATGFVGAITRGILERSCGNGLGNGNEEGQGMSPPPPTTWGSGTTSISWWMSSTTNTQ